MFIKFLVKHYAVQEGNLKFGLQVFSDMKSQESLLFWIKHLNVDRNQFQKVVITPARGIGTYKHEVKHGVLTVHYNNKKLRQILGEELMRFGFSDVPA
ncbi:MAG: hypothetical protein COU08_00080 [Candidatus Harrisonbacteria bacterium CG10_big_fil_rev_8_21_14_0_10_42_17]|uniref:Uncharacterized protein n=1 Tax=Candidatus Harrisonbacteria bacterium CG10_big_fil_rev_8_21_14_0_10_42_17 TaxID=1974584 RepID=A0A2M6WJE6_9BACT|nr:MAG: hypothetical protein COU08_00080 [Candidatus Harrisonbacteria bacterium CG10_big_fil_rev_8_21_14_0_10_42_17]